MIIPEPLPPVEIPRPRSVFMNHGMPILLSRDLRRTVRFYVEQLGFMKTYLRTGRSAVVQRDDAMIYFWTCSDRNPVAGTTCRIHVNDVEALRAEYLGHAIELHPDVSWQDTPWGTREFGIRDEDGNFITFFQFLKRPLQSRRRSRRQCHSS